jgi:hypothetical protein
MIVELGPVSRDMCEKNDDMPTNLFMWTTHVICMLIFMTYKAMVFGLCRAALPCEPDKDYYLCDS